MSASQKIEQIVAESQRIMVAISEQDWSTVSESVSLRDTLIRALPPKAYAGISNEMRKKLSDLDQDILFLLEAERDSVKSRLIQTGRKKESIDQYQGYSQS